MTKRDALEPQARELYVIHGMTKAAIAARLGVSVRTIQTWSLDTTDGKGTWDDQKAAITNSSEVLHAELISLAATLTRKIKDQLLDGAVDPKAVANLDRVVKSALKAFEYQRKNPPKAGPMNRADKQADLKHKIRDALGIR